MESDATTSYHPQKSYREKRVLESIIERLNVNEQVTVVLYCDSVSMSTVVDCKYLPRKGDLVVVNLKRYRVDWITHNYDTNKIEVALVVFP